MKKRKYRRKRDRLSVLTKNIERITATKNPPPDTALDLYKQEILDTRVTVSGLLSKRRKGAPEFLKKTYDDISRQELMCTIP
jgi:hypothetical protein